MRATIQEFWETVFSVDPCRSYIWRIGTQTDPHARHSTTVQCFRLTDYVTLNFNNNMSTTTVFLDTEKAFNKTWHLGLLYKLS
jgi:hypothetical protein